MLCSLCRAEIDIASAANSTVLFVLFYLVNNCEFSLVDDLLF